MCQVGAHHGPEGAAAGRGAHRLRAGAHQGVGAADLHRGQEILPSVQHRGMSATDISLVLKTDPLVKLYYHGEGPY